MQECLNALRSDVRYFIVREFISPYMDVLVPGKRNGSRPHVGRDEFFAMISDADDKRQRRVPPGEKTRTKGINHHKEAAKDAGAQIEKEEQERLAAVERHRNDVWRLLLLVLEEKLETNYIGASGVEKEAEQEEEEKQANGTSATFNKSRTCSSPPLPQSPTRQDAGMDASTRGNKGGAMEGDAAVAEDAAEEASCRHRCRAAAAGVTNLSTSTFDQPVNTTTATSPTVRSPTKGGSLPLPPPPPPGHVLFTDLQWLVQLDSKSLVAGSSLRRVLHALADHARAQQHHTVIDRVQFFVSLMEVHRACRRPVSNDQALLLLASCLQDAELRRAVSQFARNIADGDKRDLANEQRRQMVQLGKQRSKNGKDRKDRKQQPMVNAANTTTTNNNNTITSNSSSETEIKELPENIDALSDGQRALYLRTLRRRSVFALACELNSIIIKQRTFQQQQQQQQQGERAGEGSSSSWATPVARKRKNKSLQQQQQHAQPPHNPPEMVKGKNSKKGKYPPQLHVSSSPLSPNPPPSVSEAADYSGSEGGSSTVVVTVFEAPCGDPPPPPSAAPSSSCQAAPQCPPGPLTTVDAESNSTRHEPPPPPPPPPRPLDEDEGCPLSVPPALFAADHPCVFLIQRWSLRDLLAVERDLRGEAMPKAHTAPGLPKAARHPLTHHHPNARSNSGKHARAKEQHDTAEEKDEDEDEVGDSSSNDKGSDVTESEPDDAPDYESMILHMFPEPTTDVSIAHKVINLSAAKPVDSSFITDYCQYKYKQARDMHDMLAYIPLLVLFLILVYSGRGLRPAAHDGHGIYHATVAAIDAATFPVCSFNENGTIVCSATETATLADVRSVSGLHSMLSGFLPALLWPTANASAGGTLVGNRLKPVGALKIRQLRVRREAGKSSDFWGVRYLESVTADYSSGGGVAPDSVLALPKLPPFSIDSMSKDRHATISGLSAVADVVLPPFDGGSFFSCEALNASSTNMGGDRSFPCSGHAIVVPFNRTREEFEGLAAAISNNGWIDLQSRRLFIEYFLFHKSIGMFVSVRHIFEIHAGGQVLTTTTTSPFFFADKASQGTAEYVILGVFAVYCVILLLHCVLFRTGLVSLTRSVSSLAASEKKTTTPEEKPLKTQILESISFGNTWAMMDLVNLVCFFISLGLRIGLWLPKGAPVDPVWQLQHFPRHYDEAFVAFETVAIADAVCVVFTILSLFRFTKYFPSFDAVANTLSLSVGPGLALLLLTLVCVVGFAICATIIYGDVYYEVRSVDIAILTSLSSFWSNHDYRAYTPFQPIVSYLYVLNYNFIFVAFFVNAVVAVFSDAFSEVQESTFRPDTIEAILNNNPHHLLLTSSLKRRIAGSPFVLLAKAAVHQLRKLCQPYSDDDRYTYDAYYRRLMYDILCLFQPEVFGKLVAYPHPDDRTEVCAELVRLCEENFHVPTTTQPRAVRGQKEIASIMDYARGLFRNPLDYTLVMVLYVYVPQMKFKQFGIDMLYDAARAHKKWMTDVESKTVHVSKEEVKEFRFRSRNETEKRAEIVVKHRQRLAYVLKKEANNNNTGAFEEVNDRSPVVITPSGSVSPQPSANSLEELIPTLEAKVFMTAATNKVNLKELQRKKEEDFCDNALALVDSMHYLHRRFFLSVVASARWAHFTEDATLTEERFVEICESIENFPLAYGAYMGPADAYRQLRIEVWKEQNAVGDIFMRHLLPLAQDSFAVRCFGFDFTMHDVYRMDKAIRNMATMDLQFQLQVNKSKSKGDAAEGGGMTAEEAMEAAAGHSPLLRKNKRRAQQQPPLSTATATRAPTPMVGDAVMGHGEEEQAVSFSTTPGAGEDDNDGPRHPTWRQKQVSVEVPLEVAATGADMDDGKFFDARDFPEDAYLLTENEFRSAWRSTKWTYPSDAVTRRVFSIFPDGRLDAKLFLYFSRANTLSHQYHAFHVDFARWMDQYSRFAFWALFYVPFMVLVVFSALYGYDHSEVVHISLSLTNDFQLEAPNSVDDVTNWLTDTVIDKVWSQSQHLPAAAWTPTNTTTTPGGVSDVFRPSPLLYAHAGVNFMVGALRIRQQRVGTASPAYCKTILSEFFGENVATNGLRFPSGISGNAAMEAFYNTRVQQDFGADYLHGSCHLSFDYGALRRENTIHLPDANATAAAIGAGKSVDPRVQAAFDFKASTVGSRCEAHDATYAPGGYILDIPFANTSVDAAKALMKEALALGWLDDTSRFLVAEFVTYNPNLLVYTHSRFGVEITAAGAYYPIAFTRSMDGEPNPIWLTALLSFLLISLLVVYLMLIVTTLHSAVSDKRPSLSAGLRIIINTLFLYPWFFMDVIIVCLLLIPWAWRLYLSNEVIISAIHNFGLYPAHVEERCYVVADTIRVIEGTTILVIFIRSFNLLSVFRNLAIISQTIALALKDLVSISVFFAVSLIAFAITAQLLFGYQVNTYASLPLAFLDLFLVSFGSDSIYGDIYPVRPVVAPIYQIAFTTVCSIIFYNMITAILTGALGEVKGTVFDGTRAKASILESWKDQTRAHRGQQGVTDARLAAAFSAYDNAETKKHRSRIEHEQRRRAHSPWRTLQRAVLYTFRTTSVLQEITHGLDVLSGAVCCCCRVGRRPRTDQVHPSANTASNDSGSTNHNDDNGITKEVAPSRKPRDGPTLPPKLCAKLYSFRTVWGSLSEWWSTLDTGLPQEAAVAGMKILIVAQEVADDQERRKRRRLLRQMEVFYSALSAGGGREETRQSHGASPASANHRHPKPQAQPSSDTTVLNHRAALRQRFREEAKGILGEILVTGEGSGKIISEQTVAPSSNAAGNATNTTTATGPLPWWAPRMNTFGRRRRLPIWNELLFSKFETEFPNLAFHLVTVPLYLTMFPSVRTHHHDSEDDDDNEWFMEDSDGHSKGGSGWMKTRRRDPVPLDDDDIWDNLVRHEESYLWLTALEGKHYFDLEREKYTVDMSGDQEDASDDDAQ